MMYYRISKNEKNLFFGKKNRPGVGSDLNSGTNVRKMIFNNPKLDLVNINAYIKFCEILSIRFQDIEWKGNLDLNQGP